MGRAEGLVELALKNGFAMAGCVDLQDAMASPEYQRAQERYDRWVSAGNQGTMTYLERGRERRLDPRNVFRQAQSALVVGETYNAKPVTEMVRFSRYLENGDYHSRIGTKLESTLKEFSDLEARGQVLGKALEWKICVDTSAVMERTLGALSGLGWIGKNGMLIHPRLGSYFFIGVALLNTKLDSVPHILPDLCGNCERCLAGCPTRAFREPRSLDSRKCIAYQTIEFRGEPPVDWGPRDGWVAGCDRCQEVCPFNFKAAQKASRHPQPPIHLSKLLELSESDYQDWVSKSALNRVKYLDFQRNLALVAAESFSPEHVKMLNDKIEASHGWLRELWIQARNKLNQSGTKTNPMDGDRDVFC